MRMVHATAEEGGSFDVALDGQCFIVPAVLRQSDPSL
jgi:hypothetical protein